MSYLTYIDGDQCDVDEDEHDVGHDDEDYQNVGHDDEGEDDHKHDHDNQVTCEPASDHRLVELVLEVSFFALKSLGSYLRLPFLCFWVLSFVLFWYIALDHVLYIYVYLQSGKFFAKR